MRILHAASPYVSKNQRDNERLRRAQKTWNALYQRHAGVFIPSHIKILARTAKEVGDNRDVPFLKDVVNYAIEDTDPEDQVVFTNADTSFCFEAIEVVSKTLFERPCLWSHRRDMDKFHRVQLTQADMLARGERSEGVDLIAFTREWWLEHESKIPDFLLGYQAWDWVFRFYMGKEAKVREIIYHESHLEPYWSQQKLIARGNLYNRKLAKEWAMARPDYSQLLKQWPDLRNY